MDSDAAKAAYDAAKGAYLAFITSMAEAAPPDSMKITGPFESLTKRQQLAWVAVVGAIRDPGRGGS